MHTLLSTFLTPPAARYSNPTLTRLLKQQWGSLSQTVNWLNQYGPAAESNHPLVRLAYSFIFPADYDSTSVYSSTNEIRPQLAAGVGITTPIQAQRPFDSLFYEDCHDYVLSINDFRYVDALSSLGWRNLSPIKVLYQPYILPSHYYPVGHGDATQRYSVIAVDIPMMAVMMAGWQKENKRKPLDSQLSIELFVGRYLLPSMLVSQYNGTLLNLTRAYSASNVMKPSVGRSMVSNVVFHDDDIETEWDELLMQLMGKDLDLAEFIRCLPNVVPELSLLDAVPSVKVSDTIEVYTAQFLAWLPWVEAGAVHTYQSPYVKSFRNKIRGVKRKVLNRQILRKIESSELRESVSERFDSVCTLYDV